jgi:hypothetical protein
MAATLHQPALCRETTGPDGASVPLVFPGSGLTPTTCWPVPLGSCAPCCTMLHHVAPCCTIHHAIWRTMSMALCALGGRAASELHAMLSSWTVRGTATQQCTRPRPGGMPPTPSHICTGTRPTSAQGLAHICTWTWPTSAPGLGPHLHRDSAHICTWTWPTSAQDLAHICTWTWPTSAPGLGPHLHRDSAHICTGTRPTSAPGLGPHLPNRQ